MGNIAEEFSIGNMAPVVPVSGEVLSKDKVAKPAKLDFSIEENKTNMDEVKDNITSEFDAIDMMVPGSNVTEKDSNEDNEMEESPYIRFDDDEQYCLTEGSNKDIDDDMKPIIDKLNDKGYKTKYSCSGHPSSRIKKDKFRDGILYNKLYSTARIVFGDNYDLSAPKGWIKKVLNDGANFSIYVKPPTFKIVDGLPKDAFYKWKQKYMNALTDWVDNLPKANEVPETDGTDIEESVIDDLLIDAL